MNGTVGSNFQAPAFRSQSSVLHGSFLPIFYITYRSVNRIDRNYIHIGAIFAVFVSRNITTTLLIVISICIVAFESK